METLINSFLNYVKVEKGLAPNTIAAYKRDLNKFAAFIKKRGPDDYHGVARRHRRISGGALSEPSRQPDVWRAIWFRCAISFKFARMEDIITDRSYAEHGVAQGPEIAASLSAHGGSGPVAGAAGSLRTPYGLRDRAMIEVLYSTGLARLGIDRSASLRLGHAHGLLALHREG